MYRYFITRLHLIHKKIAIFLPAFFAVVLLYGKPSIPPAAKMVAGIEVGAKGVKFVLLDVTGKDKTEASYKILKDSTVNTDFISFTQSSLQTTSAALSGLYKMARNEYRLPASRIAVVISSGVAQSAVYNNKTEFIELLSNSFTTQINEPGRYVPVISPEEESEYSMMGAVTENILIETLLLDIGSGNTKGGFYNESSEDFAPCYISWGTKSISNQVKLKAGESALNYLNTLDLFFSQTVSPALHNMVTSRAGLTEKSNNFISGGIAWALMNCMLQGKEADDYLKIEPADIAAFRDKIRNAFLSNRLSPSFFTANMPDGKQKETYTASLNSVWKVYTEKDLLCGTELVYALVKKLVAEGCTGMMLLTTKGKYGWMPGYIISGYNQQ